MNYFTAAALFTASLSCSMPSLAAPLPPADKAAHFAISSLGVATSLRVAQAFDKKKTITPTARVTASLLWMAIGFAKEMSDAKSAGGEFSEEDMAANFGGIIYGNVLMIEF